MTVRLLLAAVSLVLVISCAASIPAPATLDTTSEPCAFCRMIASDQRFASQVVAPGEEPKFFDDMGCLERYLTAAPALQASAVVYVADHRTKVWVKADRAVFTRMKAGSAPMGSPIIAHENITSRDADPDAIGGETMTISDAIAGLRPKDKSQ